MADLPRVGHAALSRRRCDRRRSCFGFEFSWCLAGGAWPAAVLDLTRNRVLPGSPDPSLGPGAGGAPRLRVGFCPRANRVRPARRSPGCHQAAVAVTPSGRAVPAAMAASRATRLVMTTNSWRSSAAAAAVRACPSWSWLELRLVRAAWRACQTGLCGKAAQIARQAAVRDPGARAVEAVRVAGLGQARGRADGGQAGDGGDQAGQVQLIEHG